MGTMDRGAEGDHVLVHHAAEECIAPCHPMITLADDAGLVVQATSREGKADDGRI